MELKDVKKNCPYSSREVQEFMGLTYMALYRLVQSGKLKAYNVSSSSGKRIFRFRAEDVQKYYNSLPGSSYGLENVHK